MERCSNCESDQTRRIKSDYRYKESGLDNVILVGIELIHCAHCGNDDPIISRIAKLNRALALAVVRKPVPLDGQDIRFLRKYIKMTGEQFSKLLRVDKTTLSKWENSADPVGAQSDRLVRMIALALGDLGHEAEWTVRHSFPEISEKKRVRSIQLTSDLKYQYAIA